MKKQQIICIANQKGGVGKTTTALNIGAALCRAEKKVLLIDLDPQANLSDYLGYEGTTKTICDLMLDAANNRELNFDGCIQKNKENLDYIPSSIALSGAEIFLATAFCREGILKKVTSSQSLHHYDYIIIDCLPSLGILLTNALVAGDKLLIPVQAQKFALDGLDALLGVYDLVKTNINHSLEIAGILITMADNTNMAKAVEQNLQMRFSKELFETKIRRSVEATNSTYDRKSLVATKGSKLGEEYMAVACEMINRL